MTDSREFAAGWVLAILLLSMGPSGQAQTVPPRLRQTLRTHWKASERQVTNLERGGIVVYDADTPAGDEIMLVGMTRIWATPEAFLRSYRDITVFEASPGVMASAKFSTPPTLADLDGLTFTKADIEELKSCRAGSCAIKIDDEGVRFLQNSIKWDAPDAEAKASDALRRLWLQYLLRYQERGNAGLPVYHDSPETVSVEAGFDSLLKESAGLEEYAPQLAGYLRTYPQQGAEPADEFFYWQLGAFGLKPVNRLTHVVIARRAATFGDAYVIASKMLYANHYFRSALEVRFLIPGQDQHVGGMHYLVIVQRSHVDGVQGFRGRILRAFAVRRARHAMEKYLAGIKQKVERQFNTD